MVAQYVSFIAAALGFAAVTAPAAMADVITNDTYIDSYDATQYGLAKNSDVNYGGSAATKIVVSAGSDSFPLATSSVRTLFTLPDSFWTTVGSSDVASTVVTFRIRNNNNGSPFTQTVGIYPLLHTFVAGDGFQPTVPGGTIPGTQGGTENLPGAAIGADWVTYDGEHAWTAGGVFDSANGSDGILNAGTTTTLSWDITNLINNPTTRGEIQNYGLLLKINDDLHFPANGSQQFLSFYSYEGANTQGTPSAFYPVVTYSLAAAIPEPASMGLLAVGAGGLLIRRKRKVVYV